MKWKAAVRQALVKVGARILVSVARHPYNAIEAVKQAALRVDTAYLEDHDGPDAT